MSHYHIAFATLYSNLSFVFSSSISSFFSGDTFEENIKRHEAYLALKLGLKSGDKVLVRFEIPIFVNFYRNQSLERTFSTDLLFFI